VRKKPTRLEWLIFSPQGNCHELYRVDSRRTIPDLCLFENRNVKKIRFDGDYKLLRGNVSEEEKFDRYLIELLSFIEQTSIIVQTIDGLKEEDRVKVEELGGKVKNNLGIINSYSAILPLNRIEGLAEFSRVVHIWYDRPLFGFYKHGGEI